MDLIKRFVKFSFSKAGFSIARLNNPNGQPAHSPEVNSNPAIKGYIDAKSIIEKASSLNLSAAEYCYQVLGWGSPLHWVKELENVNIFTRYRGKQVLELGTGAGLLLSEAIKRLAPCEYVSYEPSETWSKYLQSAYNVTSKHSDGETLSGTADESIDLLFVNGVFVYIQFVYSAKYWKEVVRVVKPGGTIIFDVFTEDCMTDGNMEKWLESKLDYPALIPNQTVENFFIQNNFSEVHTFFDAFGPGISKYFVFEKNST